MKLWKDKDLKIAISDIETLKCCTDLGFYNPDTKEWFEFEMSEYRNDLYPFVKFYTSSRWEYIVGYNFKAFDAQVIQYIIDNSQNWYDLNGREIAGKVYTFVQKLIDDQSYNLLLPYFESQFSVPVIDVYLVFGLDNEARRSSLKKCEFQIDYHSVEEMPIHHSTDNLTEEEVAEIKSYRKNDVLATFELLKMAIGETDHPIYKGNNQLESRIDIEEEFGINCLNYSDIKIGEEILKKSYAEVKKIKAHEFPRRGTFRKTIELTKCVPNYVEFKTDKLKALLSQIRSASISQTDKLENKFEFFKTEYIQALGGLHSVNKNEIYEESEDVEIHDYDVSSMYPAIIVNNGYYPKHLGKELLVEYTKLYNRRLDLKPLSKKDKKIKGIVDGLKLALNAVFGKLGSMESWLYDKQTLLSVTLTGQFSLLMLIEAYELAGFHVISANTDGVTVLVKKDRIDDLNIINKEWEAKTKFILEKANYKKIIYSTVNDYIAIDGDGKVKSKGDFIKDFELWKNKSFRIIPLALEQYFINNINPIEFIQNHKNIYDFVIMARATGQLHLEMQEYGTYEVTRKMLEDDGWTYGKHGWISSYAEIWSDENEKQEAMSFEDAKKIYLSRHPVNTRLLKKLVRYYLSDNSKWKLYKRGIGSTGKKTNVSTNASNILGDIYIQYFNQFEDRENYNIAYKHYILKVLERIDKIEKTKKAKTYAEGFKPTQQGSLF